MFIIILRKIVIKKIKSVLKMISVKEAIDIIKEFRVDYQTQIINITDSLNKINVKDIYSNLNIPSVPTSTRDGYGFNSNNPNKIGEYIATGGFVSSLYDSVIMLEHVEDNEIIVKPEKGQYIRKIGSDIKKNQLILEKDSIIDAYTIGLCIMAGIKKIRVKRTSNIKIAVMSSGDEIIDINSTNEIRNNKVYDCNRIMLINKLKEYPFEIIDLGIAQDKIDSIQENFNYAFSKHVEIIITSGGTSIGKKDFMSDIIKNNNGELIISRINMMPGKQFLFSVLSNGTIVICLSGNPISTVVGFEILIKPYFDSIFLINRQIDNIYYAGEDIINTDLQKYHYMRATIQDNNCYLTENQVSSNILGIKNVKALICVEPNYIIKKGDLIENIHIINETIIKNKIGILITSDRAYNNIYEDKSGLAIIDWIDSNFMTKHKFIKLCIPDDEIIIEANLKYLINAGCFMIITTGGTGPSYRDLTVKVTKKLIDRELSGFGEQMRRESLNYVPTAILSGQTGGISFQYGENGCLIINCPGSVKSISQCLDSIKYAIPKAIELISQTYIETNEPAYRGNESIFYIK